MAATINDLFTDAMEEEITSLLSFVKVNIWDFNSFRFQLQLCEALRKQLSMSSTPHNLYMHVTKPDSGYVHYNSMNI